MSQVAFDPDYGPYRHASNDPRRATTVEGCTSWRKLGDADVLVHYSEDEDGAQIEGVSIGEWYIEACCFSRGTIGEWRSEIESELERLHQGYVGRIRPPFSDVERIDYLERTFGMSRESIDAGLRAEKRS